MIRSPLVINLVGGFNPSEKYEFVSWDDYPQYMETNLKKFQNTNQPLVIISIR